MTKNKLEKTVEMKDSSGKPHLVNIYHLGGDPSKRTYGFGKDKNEFEKREILCEVAHLCPDYKNLLESLKNIPDEDLIDQYHELCNHAGGAEIRRGSCILYRELEKSKQ
jgi:hypothetical protein